MSALRIAFIEPAGAESNVFENYMRLPLMGCLYLGTILHNAGHKVDIYNENIMQRHIDPFDIAADVYCLSALTLNAGRAALLAHEIRQIRPRARIIIGGIHASLRPEDFIEVADHVVHGEAESIIIDLVEGRVSDKIVNGAPVQELDTLPMPNYHLLHNYQAMTTIPMMTSRGCPFDCSFCTVTTVFGKKFRVQSPERIVAEIKHAIEQLNMSYFFFYDDNFTANRKRIERLCDLIEQEGLSIDWTAQVRSDIAREPDLLRRMADVGCRWFFIGFESINDAALKALHKSQTREDIEKAIKTIRACGISIHGMFIFGDDNDTLDSFNATVDFAVKHHIDTVQFMILTPFPGTRTYKELESQERLIHTRWDYYNGMYAVFRPKTMSAGRLQQETLKAYEQFYSLRRFTLETLRIMMDITVDALTWDFRNAHLYSFDSVLIRGGARFLVGRYAQTFDPYIEYLESATIDQASAVLPDSVLQKD
jgi:radical SAM superfamily enzyme YgiQ (UPF0313 family)